MHKSAGCACIGCPESKWPFGTSSSWTELQQGPPGGGESCCFNTGHGCTCWLFSAKIRPEGLLVSHHWWCVHPSVNLASPTPLGGSGESGHQYQFQQDILCSNPRYKDLMWGRTPAATWTELRELFEQTIVLQPAEQRDTRDLQLGAEAVGGLRARAPAR